MTRSALSRVTRLERLMPRPARTPRPINLDFDEFIRAAMRWTSEEDKAASMLTREQEAMSLRRELGLLESEYPNRPGCVVFQNVEIEWARDRLAELEAV